MSLTYIQHFSLSFHHLSSSYIPLHPNPFPKCQLQCRNSVLLGPVQTPVMVFWCQCSIIWGFLNLYLLPQTSHNPKCDCCRISSENIMDTSNWSSQSKNFQLTVLKSYGHKSWLIIWCFVSVLLWSTHQTIHPQRNWG